MALAVLMAIDLVKKPPTPHSKLPRDPLLLFEKAAAKTCLAEATIILSWRLDTQAMDLALPHNKFTAWSADLEECLNDKQCKIPHKDLESLLG